MQSENKNEFIQFEDDLPSDSINNAASNAAITSLEQNLDPNLDLSCELSCEFPESPINFELMLPNDPKRLAWKILIVDDERYVHQVTRLSLRRFSFEQKPLNILSAHSAAEAKYLIAQHPDIAVILLDVVMETSVAGLDVARYIRKDQQNQFIRIVLRTGQPGEAPEESVILNYDINDYTTKAELTQQKLTTAIITALRSYRDVITLEHSRRQSVRLSKSLQNVCQNLEGLVEHRTKELSTKNIQLQQEIRDRQLVEEVLMEAKNTADAASHAKSEFLANMSHELRTPLNAVLGFTQLIHSDPTLPLEHRESLKIITDSGRHLLTLLNDILDMSKIEAGQQLALYESSFGLSDLLIEVQKTLAIKAEAKGITLNLECSPDLPKYIFTDEKKLRQVFLNLVSNAIKFTTQGHVTLAAALVDRVIHFEVRDTGYGIAEDEIDQLFQLFSQTESGRQSRQGTGLGLSISRHIVQMMEGDIQVHSRLGQGSTFSFRIPFRQGDSPQVLDALASRTGTAGKTPYADTRLLVVHQSGQDFFMPHLLNILGIQTCTSSEIEQALRLYQEWQPDLILIDPSMVGFEQIMEQIQRFEHEHPERSQPKWIALLDPELKDSQVTGYDAVLFKPLQEKELAAKINLILDPDFRRGDRYKTLELCLSQMPEPWLIKLQQAARTGLDQEIVQLLEQVPEAYIASTRILIQLAQDFCFDRILELISLENNQAL